MSSPSDYMAVELVFIWVQSATSVCSWRYPPYSVDWYIDISTSEVHLR